MAALVFSGCGTTSGLQNSSGVDLAFLEGQFRNVIVEEVSTSNVRTDATPERVNLAAEEFRGMLVSELRSTGAFDAVMESGELSPETLVVKAEILRYEDGSAVARLMIGFGAGSSRFDARIEAINGADGARLGVLLADKNSWVLGGGLAAAQDADSYIPGVAKKVAGELAPLGINYVAGDYRMSTKSTRPHGQKVK